MRTNIVIDDKLMRDALRATGLKTKRAAVEQGLRTLLRLSRQSEIRRLPASSIGTVISTRCGVTVDPGRFQRVDRLLQGNDHC
jgi:Bacterial antitoxin of type II TA system, VapB